MPGTLNDPKVIRSVIAKKPRVAMVGASEKPERESHRVMRYLLENGFEVVPVNPGETEVLGQRCYASLEEIPFDVEVVDVFRRSEAVEPIAEAAIAKRAKVLWMQLGVINEAAAEKARAAGLDVVMDHCMKIEHERLVGRLHEEERPR